MYLSGNGCGVAGRVWDVGFCFGFWWRMKVSDPLGQLCRGRWRVIFLRHSIGNDGDQSAMRTVSGRRRLHMSC